MAIAREFLRIENFEGPGLNRVEEYGDWCVGIKNYKPANDAAEFTFMEKHLETDEVFVLLMGKCVLLIQTAEDKIELCPMEQGKVYCIPKGVWHNTIVSKNAKMVLIENRNTSGENSQVFDLSPEQLSGLKQELKAHL
jgi:mannose-6-phosphate isomerase-like protein (cupin superfamily)